MQIKRKDLLEWVTNKTTIRYKDDMYRANYNGLRYFLRPIIGTESINFYHKGRGVFGLVDNNITKNNI